MYVSMKEMLEKADRENYAVMAINCFNLETARAVIKAAEKEDSPIIVNIFHEHMIGHCDSSIIAPIVKKLADNSKVEVALNYDHGSVPTLVKKAIDDGYSSVMIDASAESFEKNVEITKDIVDYAHSRGVSVEAEIGSIGGSEAGGYTSTEQMTDPVEAENFVKLTGIDCLAVSYGTSHGDYPDDFIPELDFERLKEIKRRTGIPLVLHGGSGAGEENMRKSIEIGVCKINVGNDFMKANKKSVENTIKNDEKSDFLTIIKNAEKDSQEIIRKYIRIAKSNGKSIGGN